MTGPTELSPCASRSIHRHCIRSNEQASVGLRRAGTGHFGPIQLRNDAWEPDRVTPLDEDPLAARPGVPMSASSPSVPRRDRILTRGSVDGNHCSLGLRAGRRVMPFAVAECRADELVEQGMGAGWLRAELGVELNSDEPRMVGPLDDLRESVLFVIARDP